jgi:hypothetical protein
MGGDGMVNFFYKPFLEFGQEAPGGDNVIRVIPPVNGLKACQVFQEVSFPPDLRGKIGLGTLR